MSDIPSLVVDGTLCTAGISTSGRPYCDWQNPLLFWTYCTVDYSYYAIGMTEDDFDRPQIGIGVPLLEGNTCNVHAYELAQHIQKGCQDSDLLAFPFGTPAVS